jgi:hypothetical protein
MAKRNSQYVRARYDSISDMTLWRWINDPTLGFPQPTIIRNRRYWDEEALDAGTAHALLRMRCAVTPLKRRRDQWPNYTQGE